MKQLRAFGMCPKSDGGKDARSTCYDIDPAQNPRMLLCLSAEFHLSKGCCDVSV